MAVRSRDLLSIQESAGHIAVKNKDYEMLKFLREQDNFDFEMPDKNGESALFCAILAEDLEMVKFLAEEC